LNKLLLSMAVLAAALSGAAIAQSLSQRYAAEIDTNKDAKVSRAEYLAMTNDHFSRRDRNGDDKLEGAERPPYLSGSASVTRQGYVENSVRVFDGEDRDRNGVLEGDELKRFWDRMDRGAPKAAQPATSAPDR
jgi:hypothetical protein